MDYRPDVLDSILSSVRQSAARGATPVVVLDLDHTLFDNGPRTIEILREFARDTGRASLEASLREASDRNVPYLIGDLLERVGHSEEGLAAEAFAYWRDRFFYDRYIHLDVPVEGAAEWCNEAFSLGATLVYLTGRDSPNMLVGTAESLRTHGFPVGVAHTCLVLKPDYDIPDLDFKTDAVRFISTLGEVVAAFDNEPGNCNLFARAYETCTSVFLDTAMAPGAPPLDDGIVALRDFSR